MKTNEWDIKKYKMYSLKKRALGSLMLQLSTCFEAVIVEIGTIKERFLALRWNKKGCPLGKISPS